MPHTFSRAAFASGRASSNALLALYCSLVDIEIALKDQVVPWRPGHRVGQWLTELADPGLTSLTQQLASSFGLMVATSKTGARTMLILDAYPELRYLRHESESPGDSTDQQIEHCLELVRDIEVILRTRGTL